MKLNYTFRFLLLLLFASLSLSAQNERFLWQGIGPNNLGGRLRGLTVFTNGDVWAGASGGGIWRSTNSGGSWEPVSGFNNLQSDRKSSTVSSIALDESNSTIYAGTGELPYFETDPNFINNLNTFLAPDARGNIYAGFVGQPGTGVFVSTDGGATFSNANATWPASITGANFDTQNPWVSVQKVIARNGRVLAATLRGVFYSDDKFQTVTKSTDTSCTSNCGNVPSLGNTTVFDIEFGASGYVYAATNAGVFVSTDNGQTFGKVLYSTSFPRNINDSQANPINKYRMEVAVSPSNPSVVYVAEVGSGDFGKLYGVWRSVDNGTSWLQIGARSTDIGGVSPAFAPLSSASPYPVAGGKGIYSIALAVDPANAYRVYLGGQRFYIYDSINGWSSNTLNVLPYVGYPYYVPNNIMNIAFDPRNPRVVFVSSDKEVVRSIDNGITWKVQSAGLQTGQFYSITVKPNGSVFGVSPGGVVYTSDLTSGSFLPITSAAGPGQILSSKFSNENLLLSLPGGAIQRSINGGRNYEVFYNTKRYDAKDRGEVNDNILTGGLIVDIVQLPFTPIVLDEVVPGNGALVLDSVKLVQKSYAFMARDKYVFLIDNPFSPFSLTDRDDLISFSRLNGNAEVFDGYPSALAVSGDTSHTLFIGTVKGKLYRIRNAHKPANPIVEALTSVDLPQRWISSIAVNPRNPNQILITYGGYPSGSNIPTNLVVSNDALSDAPTFDPFVKGDLPDVPVYAATFAPSIVDTNDKNWVLLGTENGCFLSNDLNSFTWNALSTTDAGDLGKAPVYQFFAKEWKVTVGDTISRIETTTVIIQGVPQTRYDTLYKKRGRIYRDVYNGLYAATFGKGFFRTGKVLANEITEPGNGTTVSQANLNLKVYPNPATSSTVVEFEMPNRGELVLQVMDLMGRTVREQRYSNLSKGMQTLSIDVSGFAQGYYTLRANTAGVSGNARIVVVRD
jgi:hypothetical protein